MKVEHARSILGRPAFHVIMTFVAGGAFVFPFLASMTAHQTWFFLYGAWGLTAVVLFCIAGGRAQSLDEDPAPNETTDGVH